MNDWMKILGAILLAALVGYAGGRYVVPGKVTIKTEVVTKEVEVVKHDTVTVTKEIKNLDGTVETDTVVTDKDISSTKSTQDATSEKIVENQKPQWKAQGLAGLTFQGQQIYGGDLERRIIGPVFLGAWGTNQGAGVSLSLEF